MEASDNSKMKRIPSVSRSVSTVWRWRGILLAIGLLAFFLRAYFVFSAVVDHPIRGDAIQYFSAAWNMVHHHVFSVTPPGSPVVLGDSYRDPGFPTFLAGLLLLSSNSWTWYSTVLATQAVLGAVTVVLLVSALSNWLPAHWSIGAGLLMAIWPHSVTICSYLLSETLFAFLCTLSLFALSLALKQKNQIWYVLSGVCFGVAGLTNAVLVPFASLLAIGMLSLRCLDRKAALALGAASLLLPIGWQLRNMQLPPTNETAGGRAMINFVQGSWPEYHSSWRAYAGGDPAGRQMQQQIMGEYALLHDHPLLGAAEIGKRLSQAPWHYLQWYLSKPSQLWDWDIQVGQGDIYVYPTLHSPFSYNPVLRILVAICHTLNPVLALFAACGCLEALWRRDGAQAIAVALAFMAIYATLIYSLLQAEPRYAIPFRGVEIALATMGLWQLGLRLKNARRAVSS